VGENFLHVIPALAFLLVAGIAIFILSVFSKKTGGRSKSLKKRLDEVSSIRTSGALESLARSEIESGSRIVRFTMTRAPLIDQFKLLLLRSGSKRPAADFILWGFVLGAAAFLFGLLILRLNIVFCAVLFFAGIASPWVYLRKKEKDRLTAFESQLPEALDFLSRALRAGHGLTAAVGMVGEELPEPVGLEFKTTFDEVNFGISFSEAMSNFSMRVNSSDLHFLVVALLIQRETGGNLAELLENLSKTVRDRMKLAGKVKVISAEGRLSGIVMSALPFALGAVLSLINPKYMGVLWSTAAGNRLVMIGVVMMGFGMFWISKIVKIKV
jgi:tight adherence protein B